MGESPSLLLWKTDRSKRLDELLEAHSAVSGPGLGRRWKTQQLNWALILGLCGEFQAYCRGLHDLATEVFVTTTTADIWRQQVLRLAMTNGRKLDSGNPNPGNLGSDFGRLGLALWKVLETRYPADTKRLNSDLQALTDARNGIAHRDESKIEAARRSGHPLTQVDTFKAFRRGTDTLAKRLDTVTADYLAGLAGGKQPW